MTLEQNWEQIFECDKGSSSVGVDVSVQTMRTFVGGKEVEDEDVSDGVMWFRSHNNGENGSNSVGLSMAIVERMRWEEEKAGYVWRNKSERHVKVKKKVEEYGGSEEGWKKYGCYVLVERFVLRRMDGSLVFSCEFKHTHQMRNKWE